MSTTARSFSVILSFDLKGADNTGYEGLYSAMSSRFGFKKIDTYNGARPSTTVGGRVSASTENAAAHETSARMEGLFRELGLKGEIFIIACSSASWAAAKIE